MTDDDLSDDQVAMLRGDLTTPTVAIKIGRSHAFVDGWRMGARWGLAQPKEPAARVEKRKFDWAEAVRLYVGPPQLAASVVGPMLGVSAAAVTNAVKRAGLHVRGHKEASTTRKIDLGILGEYVAEKPTASVADVVALFGCGADLAARSLRTVRPLKVGRPKAPTPDVAKIVRLYTVERLSTYDIADRMRPLSRFTVARLLRQAGVEMRKAGDLAKSLGVVVRPLRRGVDRARPGGGIAAVYVGDTATMIPGNLDGEAQLHALDAAEEELCLSSFTDQAKSQRSGTKERESTAAAVAPSTPRRSEPKARPRPPAASSPAPTPTRRPTPTDTPSTAASSATCSAPAPALSRPGMSSGGSTAATSPSAPAATSTAASPSRAIQIDPALEPTPKARRCARWASWFVRAGWRPRAVADLFDLEFGDMQTAMSMARLGV